MIFLAELPDKTALVLLMMATRGRAVAVFAGAALAFATQVLLAVTFGRALAQLPPAVVQWGAGLLFLGFAVHSWRAQSDVDVDVHGAPPSHATLGRAFLAVLIAEFGDLTQLATASLAARSPANLVTVFSAATLALCSVAAIAIFIGRRATRLIRPRALHKLSAMLFGGTGIYILFFQ